MTASPHVRLLALIGPAAGERLATHTAGYPLDPSKMLPTPDVILLVTGDEPGVMLFRYTAHGELAGDTLHGTRGDAQEQAAEEYGIALGPWIVIPDDIGDPHAYAVRYAAERLNERGW